MGLHKAHIITSILLDNNGFYGGVIKLPLINTQKRKKIISFKNSNSTLRALVIEERLLEIFLHKFDINFFTSTLNTLEIYCS